MNENLTINYAFEFKDYCQNSRGCSMKRFCEDEGYDYNHVVLAARSRRGTSRSCSPSLRTAGCADGSIEKYLTGLPENLKTAKDGDKLIGCLPCFILA